MLCSGLPVGQLVAGRQNPGWIAPVVPLGACLRCLRSLRARVMYALDTRLLRSDWTKSTG
jgi:hypothetical protein